MTRSRYALLAALLLVWIVQSLNALYLLLGLFLYETYMSGWPFYLRANQPLWLIARENKKRAFLGNYHSIGKQQDPLTSWGKAIFNPNESREPWNREKTATVSHC